MKFTQNFMSKDTRDGQKQQLEAIINNRYFRQKIDESELDDYTPQ